MPFAGKPVPCQQGSLALFDWHTAYLPRPPENGTSCSRPRFSGLVCDMMHDFKRVNKYWWKSGMPFLLYFHPLTTVVDSLLEDTTLQTCTNWLWWKAYILSQGYLFTIQCPKVLLLLQWNAEPYEFKLGLILPIISIRNKHLRELAQLSSDVLNAVTAGKRSLSYPPYIHLIHTKHKATPKSKWSKIDSFSASPRHGGRNHFIIFRHK